MHGESVFDLPYNFTISPPSLRTPLIPTQTALVPKEEKRRKHSDLAGTNMQYLHASLRGDRI
jgi:hypothetical protein